MGIVSTLSGLLPRFGSTIERLGLRRESRRTGSSTGDARLATAGLWFLPYVDPGSIVTPTMRAAFKTMLRSPIIKSGLLTKTLAVASLDWQIQPANPDSPRDMECADFFRHFFERIPGGMPQLVESVTLPRLIDGYQIAEKVKTVEKGEPKWNGKIVLDDVKQKPTEIYELEVDRFANVTGVKGLGANSGESWPISDFVYTRHLALYDNPLGTSDLAASYSPYWMEDTVTKLRAIHAEKFTSPMMIGEYGASADDKGDMEVNLAKARSRSWMAIPTGQKVTALTLAAQGEADFKSFIDDCQKRQLIGIIGAYLQTLEGAVSDATGNATVSKSTTELFQWILAAVFCETCNKQIIPEFTRYNFVGVSPPKLTLGGVSEQELTAIIANIKGQQSLGLTLSVSDVRRRTSAQAPSDAADELKPPAVQAPAPVFADPKPAPPIRPNAPHQFADVPRSEVALAGGDGRRAAELLGATKDAGSRTLYYLARRAVARMLERPDQPTAHLFDDSEYMALVEQLAAANATANLLGRSRIRERAEQAELQHKGIMTFSDENAFTSFAEPPPPLPPVKALEYFRSLVPELGVDPRTFGPMLRRQAFTLAAGTDQTLLRTIQGLIADRMATGRLGGGPQEIDDILTQAGVAPANPQYSDMVFRTNTMDSYTQGSVEELQAPDMREMFPVWQYMGIADGRQGADHEPHFDKFFDHAVSFHRVRGPRIFNCRCVPRGVDRYEWADLQASGASVTNI